MMAGDRSVSRPELEFLFEAEFDSLDSSLRSRLTNSLSVRFRTTLLGCVPELAVETLD